MLIFRFRISFLDYIVFYSKKKGAFWEMILFKYSGPLFGGVGLPVLLGLPLNAKNRNRSAPEMNSF